MSETPKARIFSKSVGRRKRAIASVRLVSGSGNVTVNGKDFSTYFTQPEGKLRYDQVLALTTDKYDASIKVLGGGKKGQLDAAILGVARAYAELKKDFHSVLRTNNLLTRDSRKRQRRMVGTGGKARRRKQSPKR